EKLAQRLNHFSYIGIGLLQELSEFLLCFLPPMPRVLKRRDLGVRAVSLRRLEQDVVGRVGVEGRIEVDKIDSLFLDTVAEDIETVSEVELVFLPLRHPRYLATPAHAGRGRVPKGQRTTAQQPVARQVHSDRFFYDFSRIRPA